MSEQIKDEKKKSKVGSKPASSLLKQKIDELEAQNKDYLDKLLRLKAEFENYKKRMIKEQSLAVKFASENIVHNLLPIIDDLERALLAASSESEPAKIIEGVNLTHRDIKKLLEQYLVSEIKATGEIFNPEEHEALLVVDSGDHEEDCIVEVLQKGYKLDGKVIRPAKVSICKKK